MRLFMRAFVAAFVLCSCSGREASFPAFPDVGHKDFASSLDVMVDDLAPVDYLVPDPLPDAIIEVADDEVCVPQCADKFCGANGCGGLCGECEGPEVCWDGDCVSPLEIDVAESCNPFATSDECLLPYPSLFYEVPDEDSPTGIRVHYPADAIPVGDGNTAFNMDPTNSADGVSPAGPLLLHFARDVHPDHLHGLAQMAQSVEDEAPIAIINLDNGQRVPFLSEMDMNRKDAYPGRYALVVRPMKPMAMGQRHVAVLTNKLTDADGDPLQSPVAFAALRDNLPTNSPAVEALRPHFEELFGFLEEQGYVRADLLLAWDFSVASKDYLLGSILSMREETLQATWGQGLGYVITKVEENPDEHLALLVEGDFEVPTYLTEDHTFIYDDDHHPVRQYPNWTFPFTMLIPKKVLDSPDPLPLLMFGHGIFGSGRSYLNGWAAGTTHALAQEKGVIMLATDWIGLSSGDKDLIIQEVLPDLNRLGLVTDRLQQSLVNNLTLTELMLGDLSKDPQVNLWDKPIVAEDQVFYYGVSLGGIQGTSFVSLSPRVRRGVLAVPGSVWLNMIPRSTVWPPIKFAMDAIYPDPLAQQLGIAFVQGWFDHSDPINLTYHLFVDPLPDSQPDRTVIFQEAIGDSQVPNMCTEMLARARNIKLLTPAPTEVYGLDTIEAPTTESVLVQYKLDNWDDPEPPSTNVPPSSDNGVHSDMVFLPHVLQQASVFLDTGVVQQYCDGPCDPD